MYKTVTFPLFHSAANFLKIIIVTIDIWQHSSLSYFCHLKLFHNCMNWSIWIKILK